MSNHVRVVMAQIDSLVGDIDGNVARMIAAVQEAQQKHQADLILFPEMSLLGYPAQDILLRPGLDPKIQQALTQLCEAVSDVAIVVGYPMLNTLGERFNAVAWISAGVIQASYTKQLIPNYSVFDESRYFLAGTEPCVVDLKGIRFGLVIGGDIWQTASVAQTTQAGADIIVSLNASPFHSEKQQERLSVVRNRIEEVDRPVIYVNQVGGQDELIFDGGSFAMSAKGEVLVQAPEFVEALTLVELSKQQDLVELSPGLQTPLYDTEARIYQALTLGVRDYVHKNRFNGVLLGLSGGIDSALTLALAVDALGSEHVEAVMMPFHYTAQISIDDAQAQANTMGVHYHSIPIASIYNEFDKSLAKRFEGLENDITEENLQARIRGTLLMAMSNKTGKLVLAPSNKSESAVGYSTLYGDMVGGLSPLKDVPKTWVYRLAKYRNQQETVIPPRVISRPPSAELRPDQVDQDSLPDYPVLDAIIKAYIENDRTPDEIVAQGVASAEVVNKVVRLINVNEYKRRQAAPGLKISLRAFGRDRRYPMTSGYRE